MKPLRFLGDSRSRLRNFNSNAKQDAGFQLDKVQRGEKPDDYKPMPSIALKPTSCRDLFAAFIKFLDPADKPREDAS